MKHLMMKILLWLFALPIASLAIVFLILKIMDQNISRLTFVMLVIIALILPGITLAYGFKKTFGWHGWREVIFGTFLSALVWTIVAVIMNRIFNIEDAGFNNTQALIFLLAYFIFLIVLLQIFKVLLIAKKRIKIRKG